MNVGLRKKALKLIVLFGIISLLADMTYEGARSITGPYLSILGASGAAVGIIVGIGEFIGYSLRIFSGYLSDKTHRYWTITIIGYIINLVAVPLLALAGNWQTAAFFIVLERFGKAIRVPARDAMLSYATKHTGRGWGFGLHEALDQIGAVSGPLIISLLLLYHESYRIAFAILAVPACLALIFLFITKFIYPKPQDLEEAHLHIETRGLKRVYWIYTIAVGFVAAGTVDFALIAYHFNKTAALDAAWIPFFYALASGASGLSSLIIGRLYDIKGIPVIAAVTALTAFFAPLVFWGNFYVILVGMILWGIAMGSQESVMRAVVATLVPPNKRGSAYGTLNFVFGIFWAVGSAIMGYFYDFSILYLVAFSVILELLSIPFFLSTKLEKKN